MLKLGQKDKVLSEEFRNRQVEQVVLHAQYSVVAFYKLCSFEETGSPFWEAGIKHIPKDAETTLTRLKPYKAALLPTLGNTSLEILSFGMLFHRKSLS